MNLYKSVLWRSFASKKVVLVLFCSVIMVQIVVAGLVLPGNAQAGVFDDAYAKMDNTLPDDSYKLSKSNPYAPPGVGSSADCDNPPILPMQQPGGKWGCTTGDYFYFPDNGNNSHQYITLSNCAINDTRTCNGYPGRTVELAIYTTTPGTKNLSIFLVDRGIGNALACGNTMTAYYYPGNTPPGSADGIGSPTPITSAFGCERGYNLRDFPASGFEEMKQNGVDTGIYRGRIVLEYAPGNIAGSQMSFHITASGARLGHIGQIASNGLPTTPLPKSNANEHAWTNTYPTNYARTSKIRFYFRPQCNTPASTQFDIAWDDVNTGHPAFQPSSLATPTAKLYRFKPGDIGSRQIIKTFNSLGTSFEMRSGQVTENYGTNQPYAYMMEFDDIAGGNGISFRYPFDSADARIPCPTPTPQPVASDCDQYIKTMAPDSSGGGTATYRISVFPKNQSYEASSPAVPSIASSRGGWKTFTRTPLYQSGDINTGSNYSDSRATYVASTNQYVLNFPDPAGPDWLIYLEKWDHSQDRNSNGTTDWYYTDGLSLQPNCYLAECEVSVPSNIPNGGPGDVQAGQNFDARITIKNTGRDELPISSRGASLTATLPGNWGFQAIPLGTSIPPAGEHTFYQTLGAPNDRLDRLLEVYPDYYNLRWSAGNSEGWATPGSLVGPVCNTTVTTYQRYDFDASASTTYSPDSERPELARFTTTLTQQGVDVDGTATRRFYKKPAAGGLNELTPFSPRAETGNFGNRNGPSSYIDDYGIPQGTYTLGDAWCVWITLDRGHGWRGPSDYIEESGEGDNNCAPAPPCNPADPGCQNGPPEEPPTVVDRPYVRVYGTDITAGGGFEPNCGYTDSKILAFMRPISQQNPASNLSGSGGQLAAMALGEIRGFTSASIRSTDPVLPNSLTFANTNPPAAPDPASLEPLLGGGVTGDGWCMPDYFTETQYPVGAKKTSSTANSDINVADPALSDLTQTYVKPISGQVRLINPGSTAYSKHHTVYVEGDVFILNNIPYINPYGAGIAGIPNFTLVVKGNIYIDNDVSQLDGLYIAQPDTRPKSGRIYTCATEGLGDKPAVAPADMYIHCGATPGNPKPLTVNGSFIAQRVILNRTTGTLRDSKFRECAAQMVIPSVPACTSATNAAEVFNFSPELYLSPPVFSPRSTPTSGEYQYISTLPPIL